MKEELPGLTFTMSDGQHMLAFYRWRDEVSGPAIGIVYPTPEGTVAKLDRVDPPSLLGMIQVMLLMLETTMMPGPDPEPPPKHKLKVV